MTDPEYSRLPQVVSFSGGRTSAYLCRVMLDMFPRDRLHFVFMDTGAEHPKTYEFIRRVDAEFGLDLVCLRADSRTAPGQGVRVEEVSSNGIRPDLVPFRRFAAKQGTPTVKLPQCTRDLKERLFRKWVRGRFGVGQSVAWIGVRADEPRRLGRLGKSPMLRYLAEIDDATKRDVLDYWRGMPFDLEIPEWLGNCIFCVKKSAAKLAMAAREEPEAAEVWAAMLRDAPDRTKREGLTSENVYREHRTLLQVVDAYADVPTDVLRSRIRSSRNDANTCSESCEPFVQAELF